MPVLNIYDKFGSFDSSVEFEGSLTDWLELNIKSYKKTACPPYSAKLNGIEWPYVNHSDTLDCSDVIDLTIEPRGALTIALIALASAAYAYYQTKKLTDDLYQKTQEDGSSIYRAKSRLNSVKPNGFMREMAGTYPVYPDLINPVRKKYINNEEWTYLMMCVTRGYAFIRQDHFYIDETPITNYEGDYDLAIFDPGDDVTGHPAHENWYESKEISNLELINSPGDLPGAWSATYAGATITTYLDGSLEAFPYAVGDVFEIDGTNAGFYEVLSIGSPNHTATVKKKQLTSGGDQTGSLVKRLLSQAVAQLRGRGVGSNAGRAVQISGGIIYSFEDAASTSLTSVSPAESINFNKRSAGVNWEGPYQIIPSNETARYVEVDVNFPSGLAEMDDSGNLLSVTVAVAIQYRAVGAVEWTDAVDTARSPNSTIYTDNTRNEIGITVEIDMGSSILPEFRFRRITADADDVSITDTVVINRIRAKLTSPANYSDATTVALAIRGTNAIAKSAENKINLRGAQRKLPTLTEIQNAAAGTPYDLTSSATDTTTSYDISSGFLYSGTYQITQADEFPGAGANYEYPYVYIDPTGNYALVAAYPGYVWSYRLNVANSPRSGFVQTGYLVTGLTAETSVQYVNNGNYVVKTYNTTPSPSINAVQIHPLSTPYNLLTAGSATEYNFFTSDSLSTCNYVQLREDGQKLWVYSAGDGYIYQYSLSTPYDATTMTLDQAGSPLSPVRFLANTKAFWLGDYSLALPTKLWLLSSTDIKVYDLTGGDISTASLSHTETLTTGNYKSIQVWSDYVYICQTSQSYFDEEVSISQYVLPGVTNNRTSSSAVRFLCSNLYDAIGSDVTDVVDFDEMSDLDFTLTARSDEFNGEFVDETTLWEMVKSVLAVGYAEPSMKEGKLTPIRIVADTSYNRIYTPDFMLDDGLTVSGQHYDGQDPDGVDVEYLDETTNQMEVVECRLAGDQGLNPKRIQAIGVTNETRAWRLGMRERRRLFYKPDNYSFSTEMDAFNSEYGEAIAVASDLFGSQTGKVIGVSGPQITLDFNVTPSASSPQPIYYAAFKKPNGRFSGLYTITLGSPQDVITITSSPGLDFTPITETTSAGEATLVTIGIADEWGRRAIIRSVDPRDENTIDVVAEEYVADIYADDDNAPS